MGSMIQLSEIPSSIHRVRIEYLILTWICFYYLFHQDTQDTGFMSSEGGSQWAGPHAPNRGSRE